MYILIEDGSVSLVNATSVADLMPGVLLERIELTDTDTLWIDEEGLLKPFKPFTFAGHVFALPAVIETSTPLASLLATVASVQFHSLEQSAKLLQSSLQADAALAKASGAIFCGPQSVIVEGERLVTS